MAEMGDKLSELLGNPQLMQQIMNMAQALGQADSPAPQPLPPRKEPSPQQPGNGIPEIDPAMIGKMINLAGKSGIDQHQQALLCALQPYLSKDRLEKLEKAMRAAKLAGAVTSMMPGIGIPFLSGR